MHFRKKTIRQVIEQLGDSSGIVRLVAVLEGIKDCDAWVDDEENPRFGAIRFENKLYLAGNAKTNQDIEFLGRFVRKEVSLRKLEGHAHDRAIVRAFDRTIGEALPGMLKGIAHIARGREYLEASLPFESMSHPLAEGYRFADVENDLLRDDTISDIDLLRSECAYRFDSMTKKSDSFLGVAAIHGNALAGWCLSEYTCSVGCEIGIEVLEDHRGRGIAKALTDRFLVECSGLGMQKVGWNCYSDNTPSFRTAIACGFRHIRSYYQVEVRYDRVE